MRVETTLQKILITALDLPWDHHLYLETGLIALQHKALVLNDDEEVERNDKDEPIYATSRGFSYYLNMQDVQSVVENARSQVNEPSLAQLFEALKHYHDRDSYIEFKR